MMSIPGPTRVPSNSLRQIQLGTCLTLSAVCGPALHAVLGDPVANALTLSAMMCVAVLTRWPIAVLAAAVVSIARLAFDSGYVQVIGDVLALLSGILLRRGLRPEIVTTWQICAAVAQGALLARTRDVSLIEITATAGFSSCAAVVCATLVLVLTRRRAAGLPVRARARWDHHSFIFVVGSALIGATSLMTPELLAGALSGAPEQTRVALSACIVMLTAIAASTALSLHLRTVMSAISPIRGPHVADGPASGSRASCRLPAEVLHLASSIRREYQRRHSALIRTSQALQELVEERSRLAGEVEHTRQALQTRSAQLRRMAVAHEHVRARYHALMHQCEDVTLFANGKGNIEAVSRSVLPVLGFQPAELARKPVKDLIPAHCVLEHPFDVISKGVACADGRTANAEVRDAKGRTTTLAARVHSFLVGEAVHYAIHLRKPSHIQAASTPERATSIVPSARGTRDFFIATMSHELRTPLHSLMATLDMMRADENCPPQFRKRLSIARLSARALLRIANDILDLTRIDSGHFSLEPRSFSLRRLVAEVIEESRARAESLGLALQFDAGTLPASCTGDPARIKQILSNLLSNALQHTHSGGITLKVEHTGAQCTIDVIDTGSGIPQDKWQVIFDPFVQASSGRKRRAGGTGLGLAISRRLAEAMGGSLTLVSSSPAGSTFRLTVPLPGSDEAPPDDQSLRVFNNPRGRVLVVEDNAANRYVAEALLSKLKCPVTLVESGEEALKLLQTTAEFDLILMDCQMPGLDGCETTRRIRRMLTKRIPIIAMTADALADHRHACLEAGMDDFLPKPFGRQALHEMLCKWLAPQGTAAASANTDLAARVAALPVLDERVFREVWAGLQWRAEPLRNIRSSFTHSGREVVKLLQRGASLDQAGRKALQRRLHTLVGSAGMVGAKQVEYVSRALQGIVRSGIQQAAEAELALLTEAIRRFEDELDRRAGLPSTYRETATVPCSWAS